ncbi:uncharacterized protein CCOS01_15284 [Colletotrichum costaricense]|uniref:Cyclase n=1 Tax=Colletotrichum costaricense TaxID=1209916 RepID=A0AAI9YHV6_9PEZI|nr:uncharacterized protein CCOS01_15284 [Colletotrichum costaricense]KAK1510453.1 hypothetical protein CCOS01_15284 [Colletotrichum costaricense]
MAPLRDTERVQLPETWDPESVSFPLRRDLPSIPGAPKDAAWVWGAEDNVGRLNLLTRARVLAASKAIKSGEVIPVNLPLNVPGQPAFNREPFVHHIKTLAPGLFYDDNYYMNTQSGTQWDGFRHFAHLPSGTFYNNTKGQDIEGPASNLKCSIHHWAERGIAGRGVLLDFCSYAHAKSLHFDPYDTCSISYQDLLECGRAQGIDIRPKAQGGDIEIGDILFIRSGWVEAYHSKSPTERAHLGLRGHKEIKFGGVAQEESILDWLHDCYFAAVAGDSPTFEAWPTKADYHLHEYILSLWGMPLGEMLNLETLARRCRETNQWTFFFTSAPANCPRKHHVFPP